jgi:uncharacterized coiled-coil protein SlyX
MSIGVEVLQMLGAAIVGAGLGAAGTHIAFRTRMALLEARVARDERDLEELDKRIDDRLRMIERRTFVTLQLMADVARAVHVDNRAIDDVMTRYLTAEE